MPQNTVKIAISLPKEEFQLVEAFRRKRGLARSEVIDEAILFWLESKRKKGLIRRYEMGYRKKPERLIEIKALEKAGLETLSKESWS